MITLMWEAQVRVPCAYPQLNGSSSWQVDDIGRHQDEE
jgi:hypothetical protein